jgi:hypothetical protein
MPEFNGYANGEQVVEPVEGRCVFVVNTRYTSDGEFEDVWVTLCGKPTEDGGESDYCEDHWGPRSEE